ncbi:TRAP transporter permease [Auritidibacter ignavus]|uniref:TRAP transporter permease n=1 Tax=Auritidibacter ignavus TaxID=678932 RepID=UPI00244C1171|nr:TRAP transporter permease [Auritidibacter ignavus]WGH83238.1 TRAP transporter permease [Auritidibacter ignavus]
MAQQPDPSSTQEQQPSAVLTAAEVEALQQGQSDSAANAEAAEQVLREHDVAARYRLNSEMGLWRILVFIVGACLTIFQLYTALAGSRPILIQGAIHVGSAMAMIYLLYPIHKKLGIKANTRSWAYFTSLGVDTILALGCLAVFGYLVYRYDYITGVDVQLFGYSNLDTFVAAAGIILILEATRRCVGLPIVIIAICALLYFWRGDLVPVFNHAGSSLDNVVEQTFFTTRSIFGTPIQVSSTFVFLFLLFGVLLLKTDIGAYFNSLATKLTGRFTGGPAKAAVVASAMQGTVTGSSVANTVASGSFTIPLMKRIGFKPTFAAATEATASTGGQIMPPIMGAAVFIMAEYTGIPYQTIIVIAIVPAVLYFLGAMLSVHYEAKRYKIRGLDSDYLPAWKLLARKVDMLLPLAVIIGLMLAGRTPANAALWGLAATLIISLLRTSTRMNLKELVLCLEDGAKAALPVIAACASAGMVAGTVNATGLGGQISNGILTLAGGSFLLVLVYTAIACLVLGMGLPTTANYVVTASVAAPILIETFDVPVLAAHLFVFYFGLLADITPPVCLAAYAASGIAGSNPLVSGVTALRVAIAGFMVPFVFAFEPALLFQGDDGILTFLRTLVFVIIGMTALAAATAGYFLDRSHWWESVALIAGGILLIFPEILSSLGGLAVIAIVAGLQIWRRKNTKNALTA